MPDSYLASVRETVRKVGKGSEFEDIEIDDPARNAAVELQVAARWHIHGTLGPPPSSRGDIHVEHRLGHCAVEIKRVSSLGGVLNRLKVAAKQLQRDGQRVDPGAVLLDISSACRDRLGVQSYPTDAAFHEAARAMTTATISEFVLPVLGQASIDFDRVRGIVVRNVVFGWVGENGVRRVITTQAFPTGEPHSASEKIFLCVANAIETGRPEEGTEEMLEDAARRYPLT